MLSRMDNLSNKPIAAKLSISLSTVEKHISKAMRILETDFKEYHLELTLVFFCRFANKFKKSSYYYSGLGWF
jgi:hypothetical protein